jgi:hypothetical protein
MFIVPKVCYLPLQESPKQNIMLCKSDASPVGHDQSGLCMALKTVITEMSYT